MTEYWYNTKTGQVEAGKQSIAPYLIGPFSTIAEAENAWQTVRERAAAWAAEEEQEDDWPQYSDEVDPWDDDLDEKLRQ